MNMSLMASRGISKVLIKATQGLTILDPQFYNSRKGAADNALLWSAYHYFSPSLSPQGQARFFVSTVYENGMVPSFPLTVDVEETPSNPGNAGASLLACLMEIESLTKERPAIYTRASFWKIYYPDAFPWAGFYPVHMAHYKDFSGPLMCFPWSPIGWDKWQYTDRENGKYYGASSLQIDMSVVNPHPPTRSGLSVQALTGLEKYPSIKYPYEIRVKERISEWYLHLKGNKREYAYQDRAKKL